MKNSVRIQTFYVYEHPRNDYVLSHNHICTEMVYYECGEGEIGINGEIKPYKGPCLAITPPLAIHDETAKEFSKVYITLFDTGDTPIVHHPRLIQLSKEDAEVISKLYGEMLEEQKKQQPYSEEIIASIFSRILFMALRLAKPKKSKGASVVVEQVKNYLCENYAVSIDLHYLASSYGYSYDRLRHVFQESEGVSLNQYLLNQRFEAAKRMLQSSDEKIKTIGERVGFSSNVYFTNFFNKRAGVTPMEFRRSIRESKAYGVASIGGKQS